MLIVDIDPALLMPLETPLLKVSRPVAACSRCRNAKIKCDGKLPACSSCEKNGRAAECTSTNDQFARGKERSYVSTLETRIDRLQNRLEEAKARKPSVVSIPDDETAVPSRRESYSVQDPEEPQKAPTPNESKAQRRKEASAIDDLVSDFGFLSVNATARDFYGFTSAMSYARLVISACSKDALPQGTTKALPARYVATGLIQHYLSNVFVLLPVFEESSLYASVENVYSRDSWKADDFDHWLVRMVLAISSASMSHQRGDQHYLEGIGHVCAALEHSEGVLHPGSIQSVQALVLLTEYAMLDPHHFDSWSLIGAASRAMVDLGLHQDPPKGAAMGKSKLELRRRVYHCVYALDRSTSLVQTRSFSFSDDSAKVKLPFTRASAVLKQSRFEKKTAEERQVKINKIIQKENKLPPKPGMGHPQVWLQSHEQALDLITLRQLQSVWYTDLFQSGREKWDEPYSYIWNTCAGMRQWFDDLTGTTAPNMRAFFELELLYSYVYVLSPSPRVPAITPFAQKLIFEYCIRYAELMLRLINDPSYTAPMTFYDAMRVYMTGRQFLDVLLHNADDLLNGSHPPYPDVRPETAPPPPTPNIPLPPGDTIQHFNTVRSIRCIKQITDCLSSFGIRWGYMSWNQRYQSETAKMLENLNQRLRELDELAGVRRPSMWQHTSSTGSIHSNNGSTYTSPQPAPPAPASYHHHSGSNSHVPSFGGTGSQSHISPPQFNQTLFTHNQGFPQQPQQYQQVPDQTYNFSDAQAEQQQQQPFSNYGTRPTQQFANWGGYSAPSHVHETDEDDENLEYENVLNAAVEVTGDDLGQGPAVIHDPIAQQLDHVTDTLHEQMEPEAAPNVLPSDRQASFTGGVQFHDVRDFALETAKGEISLQVPPPPQIKALQSVQNQEGEGSGSSGSSGTALETNTSNAAQTQIQALRESAQPMETSSPSESSGLEITIRNPQRRQQVAVQRQARHPQSRPQQRRPQQRLLLPRPAIGSTATSGGVSPQSGPSTQRQENKRPTSAPKGQFGYFPIDIPKGSKLPPLDGRVPDPPSTMPTFSIHAGATSGPAPLDVPARRTSMEDAYMDIIQAPMLLATDDEISRASSPRIFKPHRHRRKERKRKRTSKGKERAHESGDADDNSSSSDDPETTTQTVQAPAPEGVLDARFLCLTCRQRVFPRFHTTTGFTCNDIGTGPHAPLPEEIGGTLIPHNSNPGRGLQWDEIWREERIRRGEESIW